MTSVTQVLIRVILGVKGFVGARTGLPQGIINAATRLVGLGETLRALGQAQDAGGTQSKVASRQGEDTQRFIWMFILQPLFFIAADAIAAEPRRILEFRMVRGLKLSKEKVLARSRAIHAAAVAATPTLLEYGMDPGLPVLLEAKLAEYAALPELVTDGLRARAGASDLLDVNARKAMTTLRRLDGLMRHHFRDDPATLAEWATVRNIPWPGSTKAKAARAAQAATTTPAAGTNG